ncbi:aldo-keto reductase family 1 member C23-like protein isoform X3 [Carettochelys insculpta]|uniref:aldo-keto reductase family 1 member C23-like protein isoform X3 n=1 Tax=Carettochelys insculpta TaxID=44489 RepID=UPI003EC0CFDF
MDFHKDTSMEMNDGHRIPVVGFGTYAPDTVPKSKCEEAVKVALEVGYRHIDSAYFYNNEEEVGRAIREKIADGTVKREDIFYTGKLWSTFCAPERVQSALEKSLKKLKFDYIDLYIIHTPMALKPGDDLLPVDENGEVIFDNVDLRATWEECASRNSTRLKAGRNVSPRDHLHENAKAMEACKDAGLVKSIGVSNFNRRQLEMILNKPGLKYKPVCNQVFDFQLTEEDMKAIDSLNQNLRYDPFQKCLAHPEYPFADEY